MSRLSATMLLTNCIGNFKKKFPDKITELDAFLYNLLAHIEFVPTPEIENPSEVKIRDAKDRLS